MQREPPGAGSPLRRCLAAAAAFTIAGLAVQTTCSRTLDEARRLWRPAEPDCVARQAARFERVKPLLPARGVVAFAGPGLTGEEGDQCHVGFVAQHVLAPVLLVGADDYENAERVRYRDFVVPPKQPLVVVDVESAEGSDWVTTHPEYRLLSDAGAGVVLMSVRK